MKYTYFFYFSLVFSISLSGQQSEAKIFNLNAKNLKHIVIGNLAGEITLTGYDGDQIKLKQTKNIERGSENLLSEFEMVQQVSTDTAWYYLSTKCGNYKPQIEGKRNWERWKDCNIEYDFSVDLEIQIPMSMSVHINTINDGDVHIRDILGSSEVYHVNGSINLINISGPIEVSTINGDVQIDLDNEKLQRIKAYTLNGDIETRYSNSISATVLFKTHYGELFTNVSQINEYPPDLKPVISTSKGKTKYQINGRKKIKFAEGGIEWSFETFNGDVYIKENMNY